MLIYLSPFLAFKHLLSYFPYKVGHIKNKYLKTTKNRDNNYPIVDFGFTSLSLLFEQWLSSSVTNGILLGNISQKHLYKMNKFK